jgi:hypothetical protein
MLCGENGACAVPIDNQQTTRLRPMTRSCAIALLATLLSIEGWRTAYPEVYRVPKLGGQHESYIVKALQEYRSGERSHPSMRAIAGTLSDQDMADLAAYYAKGGIQTTASK